jgi:hypothetical protein
MAGSLHRSGGGEAIDMDRDQRAASATEALAAKREHSKGQGNFPSARPRGVLSGEAPRDRVPKDARKERDPRSAPKGTHTKGQDERNPGLEMRDDAKGEDRSPLSGFERAMAAADEAAPERAARPKAKRPMARRSAAAKRDAVKRGSRPQHRREREMRILQAPKSSERSARRAAVEHRAGVGKRKTGTAKAARPRTVKGSRAGRGT